MTRTVTITSGSTLPDPASTPGSIVVTGTVADTVTAAVPFSEVTLLRRSAANPTFSVIKRERTDRTGAFSIEALKPGRSGTYEYIVTSAGAQSSAVSQVVGTPDLTPLPPVNEATEGTLPRGGTDGQVVVKSTDADFDAAWQTLAADDIANRWVDVPPGDYTLRAEDSNKMHRFLGDITLTLPATFAKALSFPWVQSGGGQTTFTPAEGASVVNGNDPPHTKTKGRWSFGVLVVDENPTGTSAVWAFSGETAE